MHVGMEVLDTDGQRIYHNAACNALGGIGEPKHSPDGPDGHAQEEPRLVALPGGRWVCRYDTRTPSGGKVVVRVDVTALVKRILELEARNERLAHQSATDPLTGLANRRHFDETLVMEWQRAARNGTRLSLLMIDIDYFKRFNDHYGHLAGDECLRRVSDVLRHSVRRAGEVVARYGGEEFVMLIPGGKAADACDAAQRCLSGVVNADIPHVASPVANKVTISIGIACTYADTSHDAVTLVNAADAAMYRAKSSGRARYQLATDSDWNIGKDTPRTLPSSGIAPYRDGGLAAL